MAEQDVDLLFKVVLIGDSGVGKTNILNRILNKNFEENSKSTVGVGFGLTSSTIENKKCQIQIWDTAGQERFRTITNAYYNGAHGAIIVYDISSESSFHSIERWYNDLKAHAPDELVLMLVGNKCDLKESRQVSIEDGKNTAKNYKMAFIETSAKDLTNINEAVNIIFKNLYEIHKNDSNTDSNDDANVKIGGGQKIYREEVKTCC